jgi:hypothetical protein
MVGMVDNKCCTHSYTHPGIRRRVYHGDRKPMRCRRQ